MNPIIRSRSPLRLGLAGGGTDVAPYCDEHGGAVLNATIDRYAYCTIEATNDGKILFDSPDRGEPEIFESTPYLPAEGLFRLHIGVYNRLVERYLGGKAISFRMTTYSDAPPGSGLGSSSTLVVAILQAFQEWLRLPLGEYDIAHLAYEIERIDLELSGGKQDQYAATFGGFNFIEFHAQDRVIVNPLRIRSGILNELESSTLLYFTGVSRDSARIIDEQVKNAEGKDVKSVEAMHRLKADAFLMKDLLLKGEIREFAQHMNSSWENKKKIASSVSNSFIDSIYESAMSSGAYGGKVSGAGGGGFMMFVVNPTNRVRVAKKLLEFGGSTMDFRFTTRGAESWNASRL